MLLTTRSRNPSRVLACALWLAALLSPTNVLAESNVLTYDLAALEAAKPKEMSKAAEEGDAFFEAGRAVYQKRCVFCHGVEGAGDGIAAHYLDPRPRDFTIGMFKFRSTISGELPTDADLFRTVSRGIAGTAMPAWGEGVFVLSELERWQVIYFIKGFVELYEDEDFSPYAEGRQVAPSAPPPSTPEAVERGKRLFLDKDGAGCVNCHGKSGRGSGTEAGRHTDDWGDQLIPADLTKPWRFKNGSRVEDIFRTLSLGLNGTPMPSFVDAFPEDGARWDLAHYVATLAQDYQADQSVLKAARVEGALPSTGSDPAWEQAASLDVPLAGQVVIGPRWQNGSVDLVRMRAMYNESEVAIRFIWNDRFENRLEDGSEYDFTDPGATADAVGEEGVTTRNDRVYEEDELESFGDLWDPKDTYLLRDAARARAVLGKLPDQLALHFPVKLPEPGSPIRPYLYMGDTNHKENAWVWMAGRAELTDTTTKGPTGGYKIHKEQGVAATGEATFDDGQWSLVVRRALVGDPKVDVSLEAGRLIPFTLQAWDGQNGEAGRQSSISAWYFLMLEKETPVDAYGWAAFAVIVALLLETLIVRSIRKSNELPIQDVVSGTRDTASQGGAA